VFADTAMRKLPVPDPARPSVMVIQDASVETLHAQPADAVTPIVNASAVGLALSDACPSLYVQLGGVGVGEGVGVGVGLAEGPLPAWLTRTVVSPIVTVAVRACDAFAATLTAMEPLPVPPEGTGVPTQAASLRAVHRQPPGMAMASVKEPPAASTLTAAGETPIRQGAAACATSIVC